MTRLISGILVCGISIIFSQSVLAHEQQPAWLADSNLDQGLHIAIDYPRVIREPGPIDITVTVRNIAGDQDVQVTDILYSSPSLKQAELRKADVLLPTRKDVVEQYRATVSEMKELAGGRNVDRVNTLALQSEILLREINRDALRDTLHVPASLIPTQAGSALVMNIDLAIREEDHSHQYHRQIEIPIQPPLPSGRNNNIQNWVYNVSSETLKQAEASNRKTRQPKNVSWFCGDQHLHTKYSLDAYVLEGTTENVADYAATAQSIGLNWIIVTDHSNVHSTWDGVDYYTADQFNAGTSEAATWSASNPLLALYGEEMGAGQYGFFDIPSHYLAYPYSVDSTGYLENPSSGLIFGIANCESEQTIINRINNAGGFGFIAHPFDSGTMVFAEWNFDNGATGWAGLEIWSDTNGQIKDTDAQAFTKWHELLTGIAAPQQGMLSDRPGFPNTFPVGLGNSDSHVPGLIGATFTYAWMEEVTRPTVTHALMSGRCVASNGPLVYAELNGARTGDVALLLNGDNELTLTFESTSEFGAVGEYTLSVYVDGSLHTSFTPIDVTDYSATFTLEDFSLAAGAKFITVRADSSDDVHHAIANPIWLQFVSAGDANADGIVDLQDYPAFADCLTGPDVERSPVCDIMDFDRDRDVDLADFDIFQQEAVD